MPPVLKDLTNSHPNFRSIPTKIPFAQRRGEDSDDDSWAEESGDDDSDNDSDGNNCSIFSEGEDGVSSLEKEEEEEQRQEEEEEEKKEEEKDDGEGEVEKFVRKDYRRKGSSFEMEKERAKIVLPGSHLR